MAAPRIGCLAWGSLLWDPRTLPLAAAFEHDGPLLPIEFSRVALDGRVTLVIDPLGAVVRTYWAPLAVDGLAGMIRAVCLIPGSTEFGLDPRLVTEDAGYGTSRPANRFQLQGATDVIASLDALQALCPRLKRVSVVAKSTPHVDFILGDSRARSVSVGSGGQPREDVVGVAHAARVTQRAPITKK